MLRFLIGIFIILHGLVHLWYFALSRGFVEFRPEMGWSGRSWLLSNLIGDSTTRALASVLYLVATVAFVAGGIGIFVQQEWWRSVVVGSAIFSTAIILLFWDGSMQLLVQKGLLGLLINVVVLIALLILRWPPASF